MIPKRAAAGFLALRLRTRQKMEFALSWFYLLLAGFFEVVGTTVFRFIDGLSKPLPLAAFLFCGAASLYLLFRALEGIPLGTAYAVWTGLGAAGTVLIGMIWFGEPATFARIALLTILVATVMGLKMITG